MPVLPQSALKKCKLKVGQHNDKLSFCLVTYLLYDLGNVNHFLDTNDSLYDFYDGFC